MERKSMPKIRIFMVDGEPPPIFLQHLEM